MSAVAETRTHTRTTKSVFGSHILAKGDATKRTPQPLVNLIRARRLSPQGFFGGSMVAAEFPPTVQQVPKPPSTNQLRNSCRLTFHFPSHHSSLFSQGTSHILIRVKKKKGNFLGCKNVAGNQTSKTVTPPPPARPLIDEYDFNLCTKTTFSILVGL